MYSTVTVAAAVALFAGLPPAVVNFTSTTVPFVTAPSVAVSMAAAAIATVAATRGNLGMAFAVLAAAVAVVTAGLRAIDKHLFVDTHKLPPAKRAVRVTATYALVLALPTALAASSVLMHGSAAALGAPAALRWAAAAAVPLAAASWVYGTLR